MIRKVSSIRIRIGIGYVETKQLDGETNLKVKIVPTRLAKIFPNLPSLFTNTVILKYEAPNPYLYKFYGELTDRHNNNIAISFSNFIPRGCVLRNVECVYGLVAYTGYIIIYIIRHDSKIMLNTYKSRIKKSKLERTMSKWMLALVFII